MVQFFRKQLANRGAYGIIGIGRQFRLIDQDGNKRLSFVEFQQGCKDFRVNFSVDEIKFLFNRFDRNRDGVINYDEFLRAVRGVMVDSRRQLAE